MSISKAEGDISSQTGFEVGLAAEGMSSSSSMVAIRLRFVALKRHERNVEYKYKDNDEQNIPNGAQA